MAKRIISTPKQLDNLKPKTTAYEVADKGSPGLRIRVEPTGRKTFRWYYQEAGKRRVKTFGKHGEVTLAQARRELEKAKDKRKDGVSIAPDGDSPKTVKALAEVFYKDRILPHRKRPEDARRVLDTDIIPKLGQMRLTSVTTPVIRTIINSVVGRGAPVHAGKVLSITKQMFRFAVSNAMMETNPADPLEPINLGIENNIRDRFLEYDEIKEFWCALGRMPRMSVQVRLALKILLLTGVRSGELRLSKWKDIDLDKGLWIIPVENQKLSPKQAREAKPFTVPMVPVVVSLFKELQDYADRSVWVIPGRGEGGKEPIADKVLGKAVRRMFALKIQVDGEGVPLIDIPPFSPHDLRRTMRTHLSRLKIAPHICERCLNHSIGRIVQTYDHHDYLDERREALEKWANAVDLAVNERDNVVVMGG